MCSSLKMLPLALFEWAWEEGDLMPYVLQVIGFERFFEVISASFAALAQGVLIKLARML